MSVNDLVQVILLLVIIWLVSSIRQSLLNTPSPTVRVRRAIQRVGEIGNVHTSREKRPLDTNLKSLDQINPDDAMEALTKYYEGNQQ